MNENPQLKFGKFKQINAALYISDIFMYWIHTTCPLAHLKTTQEDIFPEQLQIQKSEPVQTNFSIS